MEYLYCPDSSPNLFGLFDTTIAPYLLYYSYIPIIFVSLFLGITIYRNGRKVLLNQIFLLLNIFFSIFLINEIVQWIAVPVSLVYFGWQVAPLLQIGILLTLVYLFLVFLNKGKDIDFKNKLILFIFSLPVLIFLPTYFNVSSFDLLNCEANIFLVYEYVYFTKILFIFLIAYIGLSKFYKVQEPLFQKQIKMMLFSSISFLAIFAFSNIFGEITGSYDINFVGAFGMLLFFSFLTYMIVKFQVFNTKIFATQALVWALIFLIGTQFFFIRNPINIFLNAFTFLTIFFLGKFLISSVEREIEQKEYLKGLNDELRELIKQREGLVHLITHKVKGSFTRSKYIFSEMLVGTYGELSDQLKMIAQKGLDSDNEGIKTVDLVLSSVSLQQGKTRLEMVVFDFKKIVEEVVKDKSFFAKNKGLDLKTNFEEGSFDLKGDIFWLKEAVNNLVENALRYTPQGEIFVSLNKKNNSILLSIKDTGVGLLEEDKKILFTEGGRGKEALRLNTDSTGYGLYTVRLLAEAHKGRVWAESEGQGKGSTFYIQLPSI